MNDSPSDWAEWSPDTPEAIADRLDMLWENPALAARLGTAGPTRVADISWDRVVNALVR